jgi:hypothetical protein
VFEEIGVVESLPRPFGPDAVQRTDQIGGREDAAVQ